MDTSREALIERATAARIDNPRQYEDRMLEWLIDEYARRAEAQKAADALRIALRAGLRSAEMRAAVNVEIDRRFKAMGVVRRATIMYRRVPCQVLSIHSDYIHLNKKGSNHCIRVSLLEVAVYGARMPSS